MTDAPSSRRARDAFARSAWKEACAAWAGADRAGDLSTADLARWATATYLVGDDDESDALWARAHEACLAAADPAGAARCAFWLGLGLVLRGEMARGGAWLGRAHESLGHVDGPTAEQGYLMVPAALHRLAEGDAEGALAQCVEAVVIARRFDEPDLLAFGRLGQGQALLRAGDTTRGLAVLDEAMVAVSAGEVGPVAAGIVFCAVVEACQEAFDLRRAQEWTEVMTRWCAAQPDLAPYRGQCSVYRAEVLRTHGRWDEAQVEAEDACRRLSGPPVHPAVGLAWYELGELHRLRGETEAAEEAYREAHAAGRSPQPGLALLDLARGRAATARVALDRSLVEDHGLSPTARARLLGAAVEVALADGDVGAARCGSDELSATAAATGVTALDALAAYTEGVVAHAEGEPESAARRLTHAIGLWREVDAPLEMARTFLALTTVCRELGDLGTATLHLDVATATFARLGASHDLRVAENLRRGSDPDEPAPDGLSGREIEVLRLVAAGRTNREIAGELVLSEHTVRRHLQNIFAKVDVTSRSAATAYAFRHDLV